MAITLATTEELTVLKPASEAKQVADSAEDTIQLKTVAHLINSAAVTGEYRAILQQKLLPSVKETLLNNGYTLQEVGKAVASTETLITWNKPATDEEAPAEEPAEAPADDQEETEEQEAEPAEETVEEPAEETEEEPVDEVVEEPKEEEQSTEE